MEGEGRFLHESSSMEPTPKEKREAMHQSGGGERRREEGEKPVTEEVNTRR